jgi:hypothetical protein
LCDLPKIYVSQTHGTLLALGDKAIAAMLLFDLSEMKLRVRIPLTKNVAIL